MKKLNSILFFIFMILLPASAQESGILFFQGSWQEAINKAKQENKKIFIDFFTDWCGPCLNMSLKIFPLPEVGSVYNKNFICIKMNAEKGEGATLAKKYNVNSYPTYLFIEPNTLKVVHKSGGNKSAEKFIADAEGALDINKSSTLLNEIYLSGTYDSKFLINYIRVQKNSGNKNIEKYFNELLSMGCKLTDKEIWNLYCECINGYKNPYIKQISDNYQTFINTFGKKAVDDKLTEATTYAPIDFIEKLCDFSGKSYNLKMNKLQMLFHAKKYDEAWNIVDELIEDTTINQGKFLKQLEYYVQINPKRTEDLNLTFEQLLKKIYYTKYVAYNAYDRSDAHAHYIYASALEFLIKRSLEEGKKIPNSLFETPQRGKKVYDMRSPLLKQKPNNKHK